MKVAVIGNGPSYIDYDGWGDVVVGCKIGAPLKVNYEFCVCAHASIYDRVLDDSWDIIFPNKMIYPIHMHYILRHWYSSDQQANIKSKLSIPYDSNLYNSLPKPITFRVQLNNSVIIHTIRNWYSINDSIIQHLIYCINLKNYLLKHRKKL